MEEIVIAGIAGRLPESNNLEEFWENLINGVDMVTEDDRRWKPGKRVATLDYNCVGPKSNFVPFKNKLFKCIASY